MTQRQKVLAKKILQDPSLEIGKGMREVGYSENTRPHDVVNTKAWQELMEDYFPDDDLAQIGQEGLHAMKPIGALVLIKNDKDGKTQQILKDNEGMIEVADHAVRHKFWDTALKLKGRLKDGLNVNGNMTMNVVVIRHADN